MSIQVDEWRLKVSDLVYIVRCSFLLLWSNVFFLRWAGVWSGERPMLWINIGKLYDILEVMLFLFFLFFLFYMNEWSNHEFKYSTNGIQQYVRGGSIVFRVLKLNTYSFDLYCINHGHCFPFSFSFFNLFLLAYGNCFLWFCIVLYLRSHEHWWFTIVCFVLYCID